MKFSDLNKRLMVAAWGIPAILFLILYGRWGTLLFTIFISVGFVIEFHLMLKKNQAGIYIVPLIIMSALWPVSLYLTDNSAILALIWIILSIVLLLFLLTRLFENSLQAAALSFFIAGYGILFPSSLVFIREQIPHLFTRAYLEGGKFILSWFIIIWVCDTAAYMGGSLFGKRKLAPSISPNKTIEGFLSGVVGAVIAAIILLKMDMLFFKQVSVFGLGVLIGIIGQTGDLIESRIKRLLKVKDSSGLLPGHGGIMDRFDSLVFSAPFVLIYIILLSGKFF